MAHSGHCVLPEVESGQHWMAGNHWDQDHEEVHWVRVEVQQVHWDQVPSCEVQVVPQEVHPEVPLVPSYQVVVQTAEPVCAVMFSSSHGTL